MNSTYLIKRQKMIDELKKNFDFIEKIKAMAFLRDRFPGSTLDIRLSAFNVAFPK